MFDQRGGGKSKDVDVKSPAPAAPGRTDGAAASPVDRALGQAGKGQAVGGAILHTDGVAAEAASSLNAHAFAAGQDVYFGAGAYAPGTTGGDQLIAHEMAHVSQARGVDAPTPGNYNVAPASAAQESEARLWAGGGMEDAPSMSAEPATIYRAEIGVGVADNAVKHGKTPEQAATQGGRDGAQFNMLAARGAGEDDKDPLQAFRLAVVAGSKSKALTTWAKVPATDKAKLSGEKDTLLRAMQVIGPKSLDILKDVGVDPTTDARFAQEILWHGEAKSWHKGLKAEGWLTGFLQGNPRRAALDKKSVQHLEFYTRDGDADSKDAFEKAYGPLATGDLTVGADWKFTGDAWTQEHVAKLYKALSKNKIPPSHMHTSAGIYLVTTYENPVGTVSPDPLGFGYYDGAQHIVMPKYTGKGGAGHDMVGGKGQKGPGMKHFESSALHEVGHLVADQTGEWAWGNDAGSPLGLEAVTAADVQTELWNSALNVSLPKKADPVTEADAKLVLEAEVVGTAGAFATTAWAIAGKDQATFDTNLTKQYRNQPLYKLAKTVAGNTNGAYEHPRRGESTKTHMFAFLSRAGNSWHKYKKTAYDKRVSMYSLSSAGEWFAEQYSYYMATDGKATIPEVKTKMIDVMKRVDTAAGTPAMTSPGAGAGAGAGSNAAAQQDSAAATATTREPPPRRAGHRFEWSWN